MLFLLSRPGTSTSLSAALSPSELSAAYQKSSCFSINSLQERTRTSERANVKTLPISSQQEHNDHQLWCPFSLKFQSCFAHSSSLRQRSVIVEAAGHTPGLLAWPLRPRDALMRFRCGRGFLFLMNPYATLKDHCRKTSKATSRGLNELTWRIDQQLLLHLRFCCWWEHRTFHFRSVSTARRRLFEVPISLHPLPGKRTRRYSLPHGVVMCTVTPLQFQPLFGTLFAKVASLGPDATSPAETKGKHRCFDLGHHNQLPTSSDPFSKFYIQVLPSLAQHAVIRTDVRRLGPESGNARYLKFQRLLMKGRSKSDRAYSKVSENPRRGDLHNSMRSSPQ